MTPAERAAEVKRRLQAAFAPSELSILDESHLHAGHAGAAGGHSHFRVTIASAAFSGMPTLGRHRLIYAALGDLMRTDIHALSIVALANAMEVRR